MVKILGAVFSVGAATAVAYISSGLTGHCGGYSDCGWTSRIVVIAGLAWVGLAGVVAATVLTLQGLARATALVLGATAVAYACWLILLLVQYA
jgi:hypothetical protein